MTSILMSREVEVGSGVMSILEASANRIEGKSLVVLLVDCRSVCRAVSGIKHLLLSGRSTLTGRSTNRFYSRILNYKDNILLPLISIGIIT